jgi:hypothetical protein
MKTVIKFPAPRFLPLVKCLVLNKERCLDPRVHSTCLPLVAVENKVFVVPFHWSVANESGIASLVFRVSEPDRFLSLHISKLKMKAEYSSEMLISSNKTTVCFNPEDHDVYTLLPIRRFRVGSAPELGGTGFGPWDWLSLLRLSANFLEPSRKMRT